MDTPNRQHSLHSLHGHKQASHAKTPQIYIQEKSPQNPKADFPAKIVCAPTACELLWHPDFDFALELFVATPFLDDTFGWALTHLCMR